MSPHLFVFTASALVAVAPAISLARHHAPRAVRAGPIMASAMRPPPPPAFVPADSSKTTRKPRRSSRSQSSPLRAHRRHILSLCGALTSVVCAEAVVSQALPLVLADTFGSPVQVPPVCELGSATRDELQRVICRQVSEALARITSIGAAVDFAMLPVVGSLSDAFGRRPLLLALPLLALCLRIGAVLSPTTPVLVASKMLMGAIVSSYFLLVGTSCADLFQGDSASLAALEGRSAACWGFAYAIGMFIGGQIFTAGSGGATQALARPMVLRRAYGISASLAATGFGLALFGARETLTWDARRPFSKRRLARESTPGGFLSLFTKKGKAGRRLALLSVILGLQALHDGEGDVWQVYSVEMRGWGTRANAAYGGLVGAASSAGGLLTGASVLRLGSKWHTVATTSSTILANLLFMSRSSALAFGSILFAATEDCMSAAVMARIMQVGVHSGIGRGRLASGCHNLAAVVRVGGLYSFGRLFAIGVRTGVPQLPYLACAASQLLAVILLLCTRREDWLEGDAPAGQGEAGLVGGSVTTEGGGAVLTEAAVSAVPQAGASPRDDRGGGGVR